MVVLINSKDSNMNDIFEIDLAADEMVSMSISGGIPVWERGTSSGNPARFIKNIEIQ